jgi:hypothetical protein
MNLFSMTHCQFCKYPRVHILIVILYESRSSLTSWSLTLICAWRKCDKRDSAVRVVVIIIILLYSLSIFPKVWICYVKIKSSKRNTFQNIYLIDSAVQHTTSIACNIHISFYHNCIEFGINIIVIFTVTTTFKLGLV